MAKNLPSGRCGYSVITEIELLSFPALTKTKAQVINNYLSDLVLLNLTETTKQKTISLRRPEKTTRRHYCRNGKKLYLIENLKGKPLQVKDHE